MDKIILKTLAPIVQDFSSRSKKILDVVEKQITLDRDTGKVEIVDRQAIIEAVLEHRGPGNEAVAEALIMTLADGFTMPSLNAGQQPPSLVLPWRALSEVSTLQALTTEQWREIGIGPRSKPNAIRAKLKATYPNVPDYILDDARLPEFSKWAARRASLEKTPPAVNDWNIIAGFAAPPQPQPQPENKTAQKALEEAARLAAAMADCFINGSWSFQNLVIQGPFGINIKTDIPIGVRVCFDRKCADELQNLFFGSAGTTLTAVLSAIGAAIASGAAIGTILAGSFGAAGGWIGLALLHFSIHWGLAIMLNKTANGVCLVHFYPWVAALVSGGLINGYGEGR